MLAWFSGPPEFDFLDGTEFAVCGARLEVTHPPGYPLFVSLLRTASGILPAGRLDYSALRIVTSVVAGLGVLVSIPVMTGFGAGPAAALLGTMFFFTLGPVIGQLNVLEVHGFALLLILIALRVRHSRAGPYLFSLSLFGGHPLGFFLLPMAWTGRFRERWLLFAAIPASIWLFVPIRSMFPALSHYSSPSSAAVFASYLTMYGEKISLFSTRAIDAVLKGAGPISLIALLFFMVISGRMRWRLLAASLVSMLYLSLYSIGDTVSMIWIPLLPLCVWASAGMGRLLGMGTGWRVTAVLLVVVSAISGIQRSWRADDFSAPMLSSDTMRGVGLDGVYISTGFITFQSAYLLEMEDRRPDILPMDTYQCFYRIPPPPVLPGELAGHRVYSTRAWDQEALHLQGLLFSASTDTVDWAVFDVFKFDGSVVDSYARDDIAEAWIKRAVQMSDRVERVHCAAMADRWSSSGVSDRKLDVIVEMYRDQYDD